LKGDHSGGGGGGGGGGGVGRGLGSGREVAVVQQVLHKFESCRIFAIGLARCKPAGNNDCERISRVIDVASDASEAAAAGEGAVGQEYFVAGTSTGLVAITPLAPLSTAADNAAVSSAQPGPPRLLAGHGPSAIRAVVILGSGRNSPGLLVSAGTDGYVRWWTLPSGEPAAAVSVHVPHTLLPVR
jgi:hypothetical protein